MTSPRCCPFCGGTGRDGGAQPPPLHMTARELEDLRRLLGRRWRWPDSRERERYAVPHHILAWMLPGRPKADGTATRCTPGSVGVYLAGQRPIPRRVADAARLLATRAKNRQLPKLSEAWERRRQIAIRRRNNVRVRRRVQAACRAAGIPFVRDWRPRRRAAGVQHDPARGRGNMKHTGEQR